MKRLSNGLVKTLIFVQNNLQKENVIKIVKSLQLRMHLKERFVSVLNKIVGTDLLLIREK